MHFYEFFLILVYLNTHSTNRKTSLLFYLKYIVLYDLFNNLTPNFKYPILVFIIEEKYMKIFDVDILHFWHCLAHKESYICKFDIRIRALI